MVARFETPDYSGEGYEDMMDVDKDEGINVDTNKDINVDKDSDVEMPDA
jgi:hypothetical protein